MTSHERMTEIISIRQDANVLLSRLRERRNFIVDCCNMDYDFEDQMERVNEQINTLQEALSCLG